MTEFSSDDDPQSDAATQPDDAATQPDDAATQPDDAATHPDDAGVAPASLRTDGGDDADADAGSDADAEFAERLEHARNLMTDDATAFYVGVVREGREVDSTFAQQAGDAQQEGMQALSLLASHLRLVADEADVDYETVADDAATLARRLDESP